MRRLAMFCVLTWVGTAVPSWAFFESNAVGARARALGGNFVSVANDASALYWNPGGLTRLERHEALFTYEYSPDLEGVRDGFAAVVLHSGPATLGIGWNSVHLVDALREELVYVSLSRTLVQRSLGAFISAGGTLKLAHIGVDTDALGAVPGLRGSQSKWTADVGLLAAPIPNLSVGVVVRNLGRPQFDLHEGGERTTLANETEWGMSLRWRADAQLHVSRVRHTRREAQTKFGVEMDVAQSMRLRFGAGRDLVSGGVGFVWDRWGLDSAFEAHQVRGLLTSVGLRLRFGDTRSGLEDDFDAF